MTAYPVIKGRVKNAPWSVLLYGPPGIGKSSLAASAPKPFFIDLENGLERIDCDRSPVVRSHPDFAAAVQYVADSEYETVVIDTIDFLEKLLVTSICAAHDKSSLADFGYGKGEVHLRSEWNKIVNVVLRLKLKGKNVLLIAHEQIQKLEDPTTDSYDRYTLNIDKRSAPTVVAAMDAVLFARYETVLKERDGSDKKNKKMRAVGTGKRVIHTLESPAFIAKNRFGLPAVVPMSTKIFQTLSGQPAKTEEQTGGLLRSVESREGEERADAEGHLPSAGN